MVIRFFYKYPKNKCPLKTIYIGDRKMWEIGRLKIIPNKKDENRIKNIICEELKIKKYVFK